MRTLRKRIEELEYRIVRQDEKYHKELSDLRKMVAVLEKKTATPECESGTAEKRKSCISGITITLHGDKGPRQPE